MTARRAGRRCTGLLGWERAATVEVFDAWAEIDRSHRKPAHRGSRLDPVHVSESTVHRVLTAEGLVVPAQPAREPTPRTPWPDWLEWKPDRVWAYDFTHFTRARRAAIAILDVVSRQWITTLVCAEESSVQVEVAFTDALAGEDLLAAADARATAALRAALADGDRDRVVSLTADGQVPLLSAISDNGPQMRSHSTREFLAGVAIAQQFARPHTPTTMPGSRACSDTSRPTGPTSRKSPTPAGSPPSSTASATTTTPCACTPGSATSPPTTSTPAAATASAPPAATDSPTPAKPASPTIEPQPRTNDDQHPAQVGYFIADLLHLLRHTSGQPTRAIDRYPTV